MPDTLLSIFGETFSLLQLETQIVPKLAALNYILNKHFFLRVNAYGILNAAS